MKDRCIKRNQKRLNHKARLFLIIFLIISSIFAISITTSILIFNNSNNNIRANINSYDEQINKLENNPNIIEKNQIKK